MTQTLPQTPAHRITIASFQPSINGKVGGMGALGHILARQLHYKGYGVSFHVINTVGTTESYVHKVNSTAKLLLFMSSFLFRRKLISNTAKRKLEEWYFDFFLSKNNLSGDTFITTTPMIPRTLKKVKQRYRKVILIPPNPSEKYIEQLCTEELKSYGITAQFDDPYLDATRVQQQQTALSYVDTIISISKIVHDSYKDFKGERIFQQYYLRPYFQNKRPQTVKANANGFVFIYIAHTVLLKGLHRLLDAWRACNFADATLQIAGAIKEDYARAFHMNEELDNVQFLGLRSDIGQLIFQADCVVIPSLIDNEPKTAIEGLLFHKPVLISSGCGNAHVIEPYVPEAVFEVTDKEQIKAKLCAVKENYAAWQQRFADLYAYIDTNADAAMEQQFIDRVIASL